jgi:biotin-dependent carboxylase-like uncharacterized protein
MSEAAPRTTGLAIVRAIGLVTVQDGGRRGHMHEAVPPGGALVPELLAAANRAVRNDDAAPALEIMGTLVVRAEHDVELASDREPARWIRAGEQHAIASEPARVTYLALRGGVAAPRVLDGRGTLLVARIGRPLRAGDPIDVGDEPERAPRTSTTPRLGGPIRVLAGPDADAFDDDALAQLCSADYRIATTSDRVGTRLEGTAIRRRAGLRERSRPMVQGAIEVPGDGLPIVLGPEHPTTGGYPVVAVISSADLGRMFSIRLGGRVRFMG